MRTIEEWEYPAHLSTIKHAVEHGDLYKAHTFAWGMSKITEDIAGELGLDFAQLSKPEKTRWGQDALNGLNPYINLSSPS